MMDKDLIVLRFNYFEEVNNGLKRGMCYEK